MAEQFQVELNQGMTQKTIRLIFSGEKEESDFRSRMLQENKVPFIMRMSKNYQDGKKVYEVDITDKLSIKKAYHREKLQEQPIVTILSQILAVLEMAEEYCLTEDSFLIDPQYIFTEKTKKNCYLCYCPSFHREIRQQFSALMEFFLSCVDYSNQRAVKLVYDVYRLSRNDCTSLKEIQNYLTGSYQQSISQNIMQPVQQPAAQPMVQPVQQPAVQPMMQSVQQPAAQPMMQSMQQPAVQPIVQPVQQTAMQPMMQPMQQPAAQPMMQPMQQPAAQPMMQPVQPQPPQTMKSFSFQQQKNSIVSKQQRKSKQEKDETEPKDNKMTLAIAVSIAILLVVFAGCYVSGVFYEPHGTRLDMTKIAGVLLIGGGAECFVIMKLRERMEKGEEEATVKNA